MEFLYILLAVAILAQVGIFVLGRQKRRESSILKKYNVKSRGDLFKLINSHNLPEEDRLVLEKYYQQNS